jgi:hypothetical protein
VGVYVCKTSSFSSADFRLEKAPEGAAYSIIRKLVCKETVTIICLWWQQVPSPEATVLKSRFSLH